MHGACKISKRRLKIDPVIPTRDTQSPPNATPQTQIIPVLGVDESTVTSNVGSPVLGGGWMVSDLYLWMYVLHGIGNGQEWITSITPDYLLGNMNAKTRSQCSPSTMKTVQSKGASGIFHSNPFETRNVVLDASLLSQAQAKVTMSPKGSELRDFFLRRLEATMADVSKSGDSAFIMMCSHGDYDSAGGMCIGINVTSTFEDGRLLKPSHMASIFLKYPNVKATIYMASCYSGHWVEMTEFQDRDSEPVILAAAEKEKDSFFYALPHSQRHARGSVFVDGCVRDCPNSFTGRKCFQRVLRVDNHTGSRNAPTLLACQHPESLWIFACIY